MLQTQELVRTPEYWMETIQNELYRQVKYYMEEKGINQTELAKELNVTKGYVSQILNGNFNYTLNKLIDLSLAIGVAPDLQFTSFEHYLAAENAKHLTGEANLNSNMLLIDGGVSENKYPVAGQMSGKVIAINSVSQFTAFTEKTGSYDEY